MPAGLQFDPTNQVISGSITSDVPDVYNVTVTGSTGPSTVQLATYCGSPTANPAGDDRDALIQQYFPIRSGVTSPVNPEGPYATGVQFHPGQTPPANVVAPAADTAPHCDDFSSMTAGNVTDQVYSAYAASTGTTTWYQLNSKASSDGTTTDYSYKWTIFSNLILSAPVAPAASGPGFGLDTWIASLPSPYNVYHQINASYRNPVRNNTVGGSATSRHMFGEAIDLSNNTRTLAEYNAMVAAARRAGGSHIEPSTMWCKLNCVHAEWRGGSYVNP